MNSPDESKSQQRIAAATVIIFRNGKDGSPPEILMAKRADKMAFAGGAAVFPGGRVDDEDHELARLLASFIRTKPDDFNEDEWVEENAHRIAAIRETLEEAGIVLAINEPTDGREAAHARTLLHRHKAIYPVLASMGWSLALDNLTLFARWFPQNEALPRIFDTRFYIANLGTGNVEMAVDDTETAELFWASAKDSLAMAEKGEIKIIFPTRRNLERLAQFSSFEEAVEDCTKYPTQIITPYISEEDGDKWLRIDEGVGYPITGEKLDSAMRS